MRIAVTDACIFIDLIELKIISEFFQLHIELHTTTDVVRELFTDQQEILKAYESGGKLTIHRLSSNEMEEMAAIPFPRGLSPEDRTVLYVASKLKNPLILSSDKLVRTFAGVLSIEYHGIFWIFDQLVDTGILSRKIGVSKMKELLALNMMYTNAATRKEAEKRIQHWSR